MRLAMLVVFLVVSSGLALADDLNTIQAPRGAAERGLPEALGELIALALRSNPDLLIAEAELRAAQAKLNQARLKVTQEIVTTHQELEVAETRLNQLKRVLPSEDDRVLDQNRQQVRLEAQLRYLVGVSSPEAKADSTATDEPKVNGRETVVRTAQREVPDTLRAKLNATVDCNFVDTPLTDVLQELARQTDLAFVPGPYLRTQGAGGFPGQIPHVTLSLGTVPIHTAMLAIADTYGHVFVVRDYGILVTRKDHAATIDAPTIPAGTGFGGGF